MFKKSIFYQHSLLYFLSLKVLHKCDISIRDRFIASFVKENETVLEPGSGPGTFSKSLDSTNKYIGFDLNKSFISYGVKKGRNLYFGDVLKEKSYKKAEVVLLSDVFHHIRKENRKKLINYAFSNAERLFVFVECKKETKGLWRKIINPFAGKVFEFLDRDGINMPKYNDLFTKTQLEKEINEGFGVIPQNIKRLTKEFGCDLVTVFYKTGVA